MSVTENDTLLDVTMYETDPNDGTLRRLCSDDQLSYWRGGKTVVAYSSGYALPTGLPGGIERAAIMTVKHYLDTGDRDLMSELSVDGAGTTEFFNGGDLPQDCRPMFKAFSPPHVKPNG